MKKKSAGGGGSTATHFLFLPNYKIPPNFFSNAVWTKIVKKFQQKYSGGHAKVCRRCENVE